MAYSYTIYIYFELDQFHLNISSKTEGKKKAKEKRKKNRKYAKEKLFEIIRNFVILNMFMVHLCCVWEYTLFVYI